MLHHGVTPDALGGRLYMDTGRERPLCTATQSRTGGARIVAPVLENLEAQIRARRIDVLIVDPFVSSHQVSENDNGAVDLVAKAWARLADRCNCAVELVHHTRKLNGEEGTTESGRGATALLAAARAGRVLIRMTDEQRTEAGVADDPATFFAVTGDKANLAPASGRVWRRIASHDLANGDSVGVVEAWAWPRAFDGLTSDDLLAVQRAVDGRGLRYSDKVAHGWAGDAVAEVLGLDPTKDRKRIKRMIDAWIESGALIKRDAEGPQRKPVPVVEVGEWATA